MRIIKEEIFSPENMKKATIKWWKWPLLYFLRTHSYRECIDETKPVYKTTYYKIWHQCYYVTNISIFDCEKFGKVLKHYYGDKIPKLFERQMAVYDLFSDLIKELQLEKQPNNSGYYFSIQQKKV